MCDLERKGSKWDRIMALENKVDKQEREIDKLREQVLSTPKPKKK